MINSITLTNFKRHENLMINFGAGFTAIKGSNEQGKSTVLLALAYALFGVKAIPDSLDDTVTWTKPVGTLRVDLDFTIDGVNYTIRRSKSSCQLDGDGQTVTGQTEVTNFVAKLLKVDAGAAARLTIANQTAIRGALESGPKATTELIERLAEFSQIDDLIELMQEKLTLGNTVTAQTQLTSAQTRLDEANAFERPNLEVMDKLVKGGEELLAIVEAAFKDVQAAHTADVQRHAKVQAALSEVASLKTREVKAQQSLEASEAECAALRANPLEEVNDVDSQVQGLMDEKTAEKERTRARKVYTEVLPLLSPTDIPRFEGTFREWEEEVSNVRKAIEGARSAIHKGDVDLVSLRASLNLATCSFCGKDFSDLPEVQTKNAETQTTIAHVNESIAKAQTELEAKKSRLHLLTYVQTFGGPTLTAAQKYADYLDVDDGVYPPILSWKGGPPPPASDALDYDGMISSLRKRAEEFSRHSRKLSEKEGSAKIASRELESIKKRSSEIGATESEAISLEKLQIITEKLADAHETYKSAESALRQAADAAKDAHSRWNWAQREVKLATDTLKVAQDLLATLEFNNALLKRVRACRPLLADKLWTLVLAATSSYFSDIRGVKSRVAKTSDGFQIDEHPVSSMSGSTLDALGLAVGVALVRTFLPSSPFLVLDEPSSAMDDGRTGNMLGFLSRAGFQQIILCTHDPLSETVCDHIVTLEG